MGNFTICPDEFSAVLFKDDGQRHTEFTRAMFNQKMATKNSPILELYYFHLYAEVWVICLPTFLRTKNELDR